MRLRSLLVAALASAAASVLPAQAATTAATATVLTPASVTGTQGLDFGTVIPGVARTVAFGDATSGRLRVSGVGFSQVALVFVLPTTLVSGTNTMPIDQWDVRSAILNTPFFAVPLTVTSGTPVTSNLFFGNLYVFIGARVVPAVAQPGGTYTGTITLAAAYTGI